MGRFSRRFSSPAPRPRRPSASPTRRASPLRSKRPSLPTPPPPIARGGPSGSAGPPSAPSAQAPPAAEPGAWTGAAYLAHRAEQGASVATGREARAASIRSIIAKRSGRGRCRSRVRALAPGRLRPSRSQRPAPASSNCKEAGDWQAPTMPAHYARHQHAALSPSSATKRAGSKRIAAGPSASGR